MSENEDKVGFLRLTFKELKSILNLPEGMEIVNVETGAFIHEYKATHIIVSHPKLPYNIPDGYTIPKLTWQDIDACRNSPESI